MELTILLARLMGIYCLAMGVSMLKREMMMEIFREVARERAISYIMGVLMLLLEIVWRRVYPCRIGYFNAAKRFL